MEQKRLHPSVAVSPAVTSGEVSSATARNTPARDVIIAPRAKCACFHAHFANAKSAEAMAERIRAAHRANHHAAPRTPRSSPGAGGGGGGEGGDEDALESIAAGEGGGGGERPERARPPLRREWRLERGAGGEGVQ